MLLSYKAFMAIIIELSALALSKDEIPEIILLS